MPKAVVRVDAEARFISGPPRSPPTIDAAAAAPHPDSLRQKLQKRRRSGSFLKFWLVSEISVVTPPHGERCHHGGVNATSAHRPPEA